jgi:AbrB family looped-hinge helix DNA binding protein
MTTFSKIGRRGQITLPSTVRNWLNLKEGDRVAFVRRGDEVVLQSMTHTLLDMRGSVPVSGPQDFEAIRDEVVRGRARSCDDTRARSPWAMTERAFVDTNLFLRCITNREPARPSRSKFMTTGYSAAYWCISWFFGPNR